MEDHLMTTNKLVDRVLGWLDKKPTKESRNKVYFYLDDTIPAWHKMVGTISPQNLSIINHKLNTMKEKILRECRKNKELMDSLPDLKTTSCPGKIAELNVKVRFLKADTSSGSNVSDSGSRRLGGGAMFTGNNPQAQIEKWTSNLTKSKERKTYKATTVSINLPKTKVPLGQQQKKESTSRKKPIVTYVEASQQTEEHPVTTTVHETKTQPPVVTKVTRFEESRAEENVDKSEIEATTILPAGEYPMVLARPNTPIKHIRGISRDNSRDLSDTGQKQTEKKIQQGQYLEDAGEKNSTRPEWKWHLTVPPPTPESDMENNSGN